VKANNLIKQNNRNCCTKCVFKNNDNTPYDKQIRNIDTVQKNPK